MFEAEKSLASSWFKTRRDEIVGAFKQIEIHFSSFFVLIIMEAFFIIFSLVPEVNCQNHSL